MRVPGAVWRIALLALACIVAQSLSGVEALTVTAATHTRMRGRAQHRASTAEVVEVDSGELSSEEHGMLTVDDLDSDSASASAADRMTEQEMAAKEAQIAAREAALAEKEAKRKAEEKKRAEQRKAEQEKKKAAKKAEEKKKAEKKAAAKKKKAEEAAKKKAEAEKKKKAKMKEKKKNKKDKKHKKKKHHKKEHHKKEHHKEEHHRKVKVKAHPHESHHPPPDPAGHPDIDHHDGPSELASAPPEWVTAGTHFPPHHLRVKKYILSVGTDNIQVDKIKGGHKGKPLTLKFNAGWDTELTKVIEKWKEPEKIDGTVYYVNSHGKAVAKMSFMNAILSELKWPKMTDDKKKKDKSAKISLTLQPESTVSEFFTHPKVADDAPEVDATKLSGIKRSGYTVNFDGLDGKVVHKMRLPTVSNRLRSSERFSYNKVSKKQEKKKTWKVTRNQRKPLQLTLKGDKAAVAKWEQWKYARPSAPKSGSIQLRNDNNAIFTVKFTNLYPNSVHKEKDGELEVDLSFDTMDIEHAGDS